jgi:hypothetical protein
MDRVTTVGVETDGSTAVTWGNPVTVSVPGFLGLGPWCMAQVDLGLKVRLPEGLRLEVRPSERFRTGGLYVVGCGADPDVRVLCSSSGTRVPAGFLEFEVDVVERRVVTARFVVLSKGEVKGGGGV